jgi:heme/copper-type cytochrome/quinol oxidase subunit 2
MTDETAPKPYVNHGMAMAISIWVIILISVLFFFVQCPSSPTGRARHSLRHPRDHGHRSCRAVLPRSLHLEVPTPGRDTDYWHDSHKSRMTWTLATAAVLIPIVFSGLALWNRVQAAPPDDALVVEAVGAQFQWDFRYSGVDGRFGEFRPELYSLDNPLGVDAQDGAAADDFSLTNQLVLPVNRPIHVRLRRTCSTRSSSRTSG